MKNKKNYDARFEQLVAGALLKFETLDSVGLTLLSGALLSNGITLDDGEIVELRRFVESRDGTLALKEGISLDETMCGSITLREKLDNLQGKVIREFMSKLNVTNFVLRKIRQYSSIDVSKREQFFSPSELVVLDEMLEKGLVYTRWNDEYIPNDYQEYALSKAGEIALFKEDNADLIVNFIIELESRCYDPSLLDDYLKTKDLSSRPIDILSVYSFELYGSLYDVNILTEGASTLDFKPLHYEQGIGYDSESKALVLGMFEVLESDHCVYVCHPNHLFSAPPIIKGKTQIIRVDWDSIDVGKMYEKNDYSAFLDANEAYKHVHRKLRHEIVPELEKGNTEVVRYLAVVESYYFEGVPNYVVRGLVRGDATGVSFAFNPEYEKTISRDIWSKNLRLGDNNTPELYLRRGHQVEIKR